MYLRLRLYFSSHAKKNPFWSTFAKTHNHMKKVIILLGAISLFACNDSEQASKDKIKEIQRQGDSTQKYFDQELIKSREKELEHLNNAVEIAKESK